MSRQTSFLGYGIFVVSLNCGIFAVKILVRDVKNFGSTFNVQSVGHVEYTYRT